MMYDNMWHDMNGWMSGWSWLGMTLMMLAWVILLGIIVYAVVKLIMGSSAARSGAPPEDPALTMLRERFARGEITETEYRQARQVLGSGAQ